MPSVYQDVNLSYKKHPGSKDILKKTDVEAVKASIRNILLGNPFDVPFDPHFGGALRSLLFELQSPALGTTVTRNIMLKLHEYDERVIVEDINVKAYENSVEVELKFYVTGILELQQQSFFMERTR